ncbi:MAG: bacillithiol system redox-active protein YtxJ [Longimicrobiales bacterium]
MDPALRPLDDEAVPALMAHDRAVLYKHSPTCWLSGRALGEVQAFAAACPEVPVWMVDVIRQRPLSQDLAHRLEIPHASPQVIVLQQGDPVWDASHMGVTASALERILARLPEPASDAG